jgi:hypothetical protein
MIQNMTKKSNKPKGQQNGKLPGGTRPPKPEWFNSPPSKPHEVHTHNIQYLKERIHAANNRKNEHRKQHREKKVRGKSKGRYFHFSVFLGSVDMQICMQAFQILFGVFRKSWKMLVDDCSSYELSPILHGSSGRRNRYLSSLKKAAEPV